MLSDNASQRVDVARTRPPDAKLQPHIGICCAVWIGAYLYVTLEKVR
jgi:hypothetical protein